MIELDKVYKKNIFPSHYYSLSYSKFKKTKIILVALLKKWCQHDIYQLTGWIGSLYSWLNICKNTYDNRKIH